MNASASPLRIALVNPPGLKAVSTLNMNTPNAPLGLAYISGALKAAGHAVAVIDGAGEALDRVRPYPGRPDLLVQGLTPDEIARRVPADSAVVGITCMFSTLWPLAKQVISAIRARVPRALIVLGGEHGTAVPEHALTDGPVDVVVLGEGEAIAVDLMDALARGAPLAEVGGIAYREGERTVRTPRAPRIRDVDALPLPDWEAFPVTAYIDRRQSNGIHLGRSMPLLATRGCPYACTFCSNPQMWTRRYVARSPELVVDEMERYRDRFGATNFDFQDLTAIVKRTWVIAFCEEILRRRLQVTWQMPSGTRSEVFDEEVVDLLYRAGCRVLSFAPESGDPGVLRDVKKQVDLDHLLRAAEVVVRRGLKLSCFFVVGFPTDTEASLGRTRALVRALAIRGVHDVAVAKFVPYPGCALFDELLAQGRVRLDDEFLLSAMDIHSSRGRSYCDAISTRRLTLHQLGLLSTFYGLSAALHPRRTLRTVARAALLGVEETRYAKWVVDHLHTTRRWRRGAVGAAPPGARWSRRERARAVIASLTAGSGAVRVHRRGAPSGEARGASWVVAAEDLLPTEASAHLAELATALPDGARLVLRADSVAWQVSERERLGRSPGRGGHLAAVERSLGQHGLVPLSYQRAGVTVPGSATLTWLVNDVLAHLPGLDRALPYEVIVARRPPAPVDPTTLSVSVVVPCKNEVGNVQGAVERLPALGRETELLFCDDSSTDGTADRVRELQREHPHRTIRLLPGPDRGKAANVRTGIDAARGDVIVILDGDLTVAPEALPEFVDALAAGAGDLVNGTRLVLAMQEGAMPRANRLGNAAFALAFTMLLSQPVSDTLCGTKVFWRRDWPRLSALAGTWGTEDRWGDFDLLFGAARLELSIVELPVSYLRRTAGVTKMVGLLENGAVMGRLCLAALLRLRAYGRTRPS